jgi:hypothetical protein
MDEAEAHRLEVKSLRLRLTEAERRALVAENSMAAIVRGEVDAVTSYK